MSSMDAPDPTSFREAEILGLRLMQEGNFEEALIGTCLAPDIRYVVDCAASLMHGPFN